MPYHNVTIRTIPDDPIQTFWISKLGDCWNFTPIYYPQDPTTRSPAQVHRIFSFIKIAAQFKDLLHTFYDDMLQRNRSADIFHTGNDQLFIDPFRVAKVIEGQIAETRELCEELFRFERRGTREKCRRSVEIM